ncbi:MAG: ATP-binding protein [Firmicutes bacterium]|nr:ATP-binding protein [Bacillota bacterium]
MRNDNMPDGAITRKLFRKTMLTMLIAELSGALTAIIDGILTGRYLGATGLAACGLGAPYYSIASIISGLLMVGSTNLCTKAIGRGNREELTGVFSLTIALGVVLSGLLAFSGAGFPRAFASLFGADGASGEVISETAAYLRGLFLGAPGFILFVILTPVLQLDGDAVRPKIASVTCAVVDVAGDLLNVLVFRGGMFGMALASSASHYAALLVVLSHFLKKGSLFRFSLQAIRMGVLPSLLKDGLPRAVCMLGRGILPVLLNALLLWKAGDMAVTAYSAMSSTTFVTGALGWGVGGAVLIMGGIMMGEQDVNGMRTVIRTAFGYIICGVTVLAAVVFCCAPFLAGLFLPQGGIERQMAASAIRCYAVCLPFLAFNVSAANHLQVISRTLEANLVNIGIELAFTALMAHVLCRPLGVMGVWLAFPIGQALLSTAIVVRALAAKDSSRKGLAAYLLLDRDFGIPDPDRIEQSIYSMDDVVALSEKANGFCLERGIGARESNLVALCVEEMAGNVIEHGFEDGKPHHLDVRLLVKDRTVVLRLRDDCRHFDLREKVKNWSPEPEHPEKNIGIRMVLGMAKDIDYTNAMNTNNLIITI